MRVAQRHSDYCNRASRAILSYREQFLAGPAYVVDLMRLHRAVRGARGQDSR